MCFSQASSSSDSLDGPCVDYAKSYDAVVFDVLKVTPEEFAVSMLHMSLSFDAAYQTEQISPEAHYVLPDMLGRVEVGCQLTAFFLKNQSNCTVYPINSVCVCVYNSIIFYYTILCIVYCFLASYILKNNVDIFLVCQSQITLMDAPVFKAIQPEVGGPCVKSIISI